MRRDEGATSVGAASGLALARRLNGPALPYRALPGLAGHAEPWLPTIAPYVFRFDSCLAP